VWSDIDEVTGNIDPLDAAFLVKKYNAKAIIAVDWAGRVCNYAMLKATGVPIIEDAAHAFGAPTDGDYICYSFQAIKHLTTGDGGALVCPTPETQVRARLLRWYGLDRNIGTAMRCTQELSEIGYKYQMNDIAASIGLENLDMVRGNLIKHRANAAYLTEKIDNEKITVPPYDQTSSCWVFTLHTRTRDDFMAYMIAHGIEASLVHVRNDTQPKLRALQTTPGEIPGVTSFSQTQCSIPCGWWLTEGDRDFIVETINKY
jgi:dTDP-4-amino-4,6-dideoxygalactose transaminase